MGTGLGGRVLEWSTSGDAELRPRRGLRLEQGILLRWTCAPPIAATSPGPWDDSLALTDPEVPPGRDGTSSGRPVPPDQVPNAFTPPLRRRGRRRLRVRPRVSVRRLTPCPVSTRACHVAEPVSPRRDLPVGHPGDSREVHRRSGRPSTRSHVRIPGGPSRSFSIPVPPAPYRVEMHSSGAPARSTSTRVRRARQPAQSGRRVRRILLMPPAGSSIDGDLFRRPAPGARTVEERCGVAAPGIGDQASPSRADDRVEQVGAAGARCAPRRGRRPPGRARTAPALRARPRPPTPATAVAMPDPVRRRVFGGELHRLGRPVRREHIGAREAAASDGNASPQPSSSTRRPARSSVAT